MNTDEFRMKAAMIVFALEKSLGELVKSEHTGNPEFILSGPFQKIEQRQNNSASLAISERVDNCVNASYLEEVISMAIAATQSASSSDSLKRLSELCNSLDLFSIRNAISHPNREFPVCYWYRAATIASDPAADKLGLDSVREALTLAEKGQITSPPQEWLGHVYSSIPNNLPGDFEHQLTGLIGRQKEKRELLNYLTSARYQLIAVLAPGGLGKTALALDVLREASLDPKTRDWCDAIVFLSFKQERLTADGIEVMDASATLSELATDLSGELDALFPAAELVNLDEAKSKLREERILICIDNLETLLRDNPTSFIQFYEELPKNWRVLATSRVTIDGAKSFRLAALAPEGARALSYRYFTAKGVDAPDETVMRGVVQSSGCNPLALRLIIDRYAQGYPLLEAKTSVGKDIVAFSYTSLVETLSTEALMAGLTHQMASSLRR